MDESDFGKLFGVTTLVKEYGGCRDVTFHWFKEEPTPGARPYGQLIADYVPGDAYAEGAIDEYFTEDEAKQLAAYLAGEVDGDEDKTTTKEISLPIPNNMAGYGAMAVGDGDDFYMLSKSPDYPLPFSVSDYYNLEGYVLLDGSGCYGGRYLEFNAQKRSLRWATMVERDGETTGGLTKGGY
jgi:hypothetical protein